MVPADWRKANVAPIFKKCPKYIPGNYRPVSLTSIVCKLLEGMIRDYIQYFSNENSIISSNQHGFMKNRSCQTNLLTFYEEVSCHLDKGRPVDVDDTKLSRAITSPQDVETLQEDLNKLMGWATT